MASQLEDLKKERERFVAFAFAAAEIFLEVDQSGLIVFEGGAVNKIGPKRNAQDSLVGTPIHAIINPTDHLVYDALNAHLSHKGRIGPIPLRFLSESDRDHALRLFALYMPGKNPRTFLALRSAPLGSNTMDDTLEEETGLLTKDSFIEIAARTMANKATTGQMYLTAVDVRSLDAANKKQEKGLLRTVMRQVSAHIKTLAADGEMAGQIGDTQFAFLHRTQSDGDYIGQSLKKVDPALKLTTDTATIGPNDDTLDEGHLLRALSYVLNKFCADAKSVSFKDFSEAYDTMASETKTRVSTIKSMIESRSFKMVFQPVIELRNGKVHHNEILSRFDIKGSDDATYDIIRFAEDTGMIKEFDLALCHKAIDYIRKMKRLGDPVKLAINLSGRTLNNAEYTQQLLKLFTAAKDIHHSLMIELTESAKIENLVHAEAFFEDIKKLGYKICLDDFGAGASGYQYLRTFNVDFVKIDGSYIRSMSEPDFRPTFLLSIIRLCSDLGVKTIAEHIETRFQADFLKSLGVDFGQGFLYGKPDPSPRPCE